MSAVRDTDAFASAPFEGRRVIRPIGVDALDAVLAIEVVAYGFPWSRGNFIDSVAAGYFLRGCLAPDGRLLGYYVAMPGFEEIHLLNITVAPSEEGRGHARAMLADLYRLAADQGARARATTARAGSTCTRASPRPVAGATTTRRSAVARTRSS